MKSLTRLLQRELRRTVRPVYQQLELPLGGVKLGKEDWATVMELGKLRASLAQN
jgi:hypothetical protein